jgi:hypothetical protein
MEGKNTVNKVKERYLPHKKVLVGKNSRNMAPGEYEESFYSHFLSEHVGVRDLN